MHSLCPRHGSTFDGLQDPLLLPTVRTGCRYLLSVTAAMADITPTTDACCASAAVLAMRLPGDAASHDAA
jgi:hypothetical protein